MKYIIQHRAHSDSKHSIIQQTRDWWFRNPTITSWGLDYLHNLPLFMERFTQEVDDLLNSTNDEDRIYLWIYDVYIDLIYIFRTWYTNTIYDVIYVLHIIGITVKHKHVYIKTDMNCPNFPPFLFAKKNIIWAHWLPTNGFGGLGSPWNAKSLGMASFKHRDILILDIQTL